MKNIIFKNLNIMCFLQKIIFINYRYIVKTVIKLNGRDKLRNLIITYISNKNDSIYLNNTKILHLQQKVVIINSWNYLN